MDDSLRVSKHANRRSRERIGIPKRAVERNARKALAHGLGYAQARGDLKDYIYWLYNRYDRNGNNIKIYNGYVYVFHDEILITVLNVPPEHRKQAKWQQEKRGMSHE